MRILYMSSMCSEKKYKQLFENETNKPGQAVMKYHRLLTQGLSECENIEVFAISSLPINRKNCASKHLKAERDYEGKVQMLYLPVYNYPIVKNVIVLLEAMHYISKNYEDKNTVVICDGLYVTISVASLLSAICKRIKTIAIVTDVPGIMLGSSNGRLSRWLLRRFDAYVFLTEKMNELLNNKNKPYIVEEGLVDYRIKDMDFPVAEKYKSKVCMYTGSIKKIYGVKQLVEAFLECKFDNVELHIYGEGDYEDELIAIAEKHREIKYFGVQLIDVVVEAQRKADLLINPRFTNEEYTWYSFPSKNMEYMAAGVAVLTTDLPGMPHEYKEYVYLFEGEGKKDYVNTLKKILGKSRQELYEKGRQGKAFVMNKKNNVIQAERIVDTLIKEL